METLKAPGSQPKNEPEFKTCVTDTAKPATVTASTGTAGPNNGRLVRPRWLGVFLGRLVLRVCPENRPSKPCDGCHLRALCKCAQDDFLEAASIERKVWMVLAACGLGALLMALFWK